MLGVEREVFFGADFDERLEFRRRLFLKGLSLELGELAETGAFPLRPCELFANEVERDIGAAVHSATPFFWRTATLFCLNPEAADAREDFLLNLADSFQTIDESDLNFSHRGSLLPKIAAIRGTSPFVARTEKGARLLFGWHTHLFNPEYVKSILAQPASSHVRGTLDSAIDVIFRSGAGRGERLRAKVRWFVELIWREADVHHSFTDPMLPGVIFVSGARDPLRLAEAIVHEAAHNELNTLQDVRGDIYPESDEAVFYSPWRDDRRPLSGLFHALYVFSEIAEFLVALLEQSSAAEERYCRSRLAAIGNQLRIGIEQVPREELRGMGSEMLNAMSSSQKLLQEDYGAAMPERVRRHAEAFEAIGAV